jgi:hypothetical protein
LKDLRQSLSTVDNGTRRNSELNRMHGEAEHPGRLGVDDQLELARLHDQKVRAGQLSIKVQNILINATKPPNSAPSTTLQAVGVWPLGNPVRGKMIAPRTMEAIMNSIVFPLSDLRLAIPPVGLCQKVYHIYITPSEVNGPSFRFQN